MYPLTLRSKQNSSKINRAPNADTMPELGAIMRGIEFHRIVDDKVTEWRERSARVSEPYRPQSGGFKRNSNTKRNSAEINRILTKLENTRKQRLAPPPPPAEKKPVKPTRQKRDRDKIIDRLKSYNSKPLRASRSEGNLLTMSKESKEDISDRLCQTYDFSKYKYQAQSCVDLDKDEPIDFKIKSSNFDDKSILLPRNTLDLFPNTDTYSSLNDSGTGDSISYGGSSVELRYYSTPEPSIGTSTLKSRRKICPEPRTDLCSVKEESEVIFKKCENFNLSSDNLQRSDASVDVRASAVNYQRETSIDPSDSSTTSVSAKKKWRQVLKKNLNKDTFSCLVRWRGCRTSRSHNKKINKAMIAGKWVAAKSGKTLNVNNPINDKIITSVPDMDVEDAELALKAAAKAFETWQWTVAKERSRLLRRWHEMIQRDKEPLAQLVTSESGKPIWEARDELDYGSAFLEWFADTARHTNGEVVPSAWKNKKIIMTRQPIGVISIITPWNFPFAMIARKIGAVLAAGCTCVIKPAEDTPLSALATIKLAQEVGIPDGVINVITCSREHTIPVGKLLCQSDLVAGISFTGSTITGKRLYKYCSKGVKRIALELGGNAPFIVFKTANIDNAVRCAMACKFRNNGQSCVSANKFLIHEDVFDEFISQFAKAICSKLVLGDSTNENVTVGPLINVKQVHKVVGLVEDAVTKGAKIVIGGSAAKELGEKYYYPTLLTNVTPEMNVYREEIFGPVAPCIKFKTDEEALRIANDTKNGLASYVFSNDLTQVHHIVEKLAFGIVGVNEGIISAPEPAFGGVGESGLGREGGRQAVEEFTYLKYTLMCGVDH